MDTHIVMIPSPGGPVPTPLPTPFAGPIAGDVSSTVRIDNHAAAVKGSSASNRAPHIPAGGPFQKNPDNRAVIDQGCASVKIDGKPIARLGDIAMTCNDPADLPNGTVIASGTVLVGE